MAGKHSYIRHLLNKLKDNSISFEEFDNLLVLLKKTGNKKKLSALRNTVSKEKTRGKKSGKKYSSTYKKHIVEEAINADEAKRKHVIYPAPPRKDYRWYKVAAVFLLIIAAVFVYRLNRQVWIKAPQLVERVSPKGKKLTLTLSDGSVIKLNAASRLVYPEKFSKNSREVALEGEAFFSVSKDASRPFMVKSGDLTTSVLGTSFNLRAFSEEETFKVAVVTGKVSVSQNLQSGNEIILEPNEIITYNQTNQSLEKQAGDVRHLTDWKDGILRFNNINLKAAAKEIEKWYGVEVMIGSELESCIISGGYKNLSLEKLLKALQYSLNFQYQYTNDTVRITGEGCQ